MIRWRIGVFLLISAIALLLFFVLFTLPRISTYRILLNEYANNQELYQKKQENFMMYEENKNRISQLNDIVLEQNKKIQPLKNLNSLVIAISEKFAKYGLQETDFIIGRNIERFLISANILAYKTVVNVSGVGEYEQVIKFINALHTAEELYQIENIVLSSENIVTEGYVFVKLDISIHTIGNSDTEREEQRVIEEISRNPFHYD